jgi:hypothetical protein
VVIVSIAEAAAMVAKNPRRPSPSPSSSIRSEPVRDRPRRIGAALAPRWTTRLPVATQAPQKCALGKKNPQGSQPPTFMSPVKNMKIIDPTSGRRLTRSIAWAMLSSGGQRKSFG